jgi:hypothetical protein
MQDTEVYAPEWWIGNHTDSIKTLAKILYVEVSRLRIGHGGQRDWGNLSAQDADAYANFAERVISHRQLILAALTDGELDDALRGHN